MRISFFLLSLCFSLPVFAQYCSEDDRFTEAEYFNIQQIDSAFEVEYAQVLDWEGNPQSLRFDVYYPASAHDTSALRPAILNIHGGGFIGGDKVSWRQYCREFAKRGFVAFTLGYRLGWDAQDSLGQVKAIYRANQDARAAMRYIVHNAAQLNIDTAWLFIGGSSAGAITAINTVYADESEWEQALPGIVNQYGALDSSGNNLTESFDIKGVFNNWGAALRATYQPEEMRPMISFHGDMDPTVPIDSSAEGLFGSRVLHNALLAQGVCSDLSVGVNEGHGIYRGVDG
ncbi:MAG: alpha/beta hydrolase, partial [Bacteroidota bacterium]